MNRRAFLLACAALSVPLKKREAFYVDDRAYLQNPEAVDRFFTNDSAKAFWERWGPQIIVRESDIDYSQVRTLELIGGRGELKASEDLF